MWREKCSKGNQKSLAGHLAKTLPDRCWIQAGNGTPRNENKIRALLNYLSIKWQPTWLPLLCVASFCPRKFSTSWASNAGQQLCPDLLPHHPVLQQRGQPAGTSVPDHPRVPVPLTAGPPGPQQLSLLLQQQQQQQQWRGGRGRWTHLRSPQSRCHPARLPLYALQQQLLQSVSVDPPPALPLRSAAAVGACWSLHAPGLPLQTLPEGVHQPGSPEDAHPLTHSSLCVPHLRQGLLQALAAQRTHSHAHR